MEKSPKQTKPKSDLNPDHIFPLLLSSILSTTASPNHPNNQKKIKISSNNNDNNSQINLQLQLLNHLHASLVSPDSEVLLPWPIIALIPALLTSKYAKVVCKCAKFVGAASLHSWEMNQQIANAEEIMRSLISGLACWKIRKILLAMCNAVLDMATTSLGRQCLIDCSALNCIIASVLQVSKSSEPLELATFKEKKGSEIQYRIGFKENELLILLTDAAITLINACHIEQLESIPNGLLEPLLAYLKSIWKTTRGQILDGIEYNQKLFSPSNIMTHNLAESIFRFSINANKKTPFVSLDVIKRSIFGQDWLSFEDFILNQWEDSPLLMDVFPKALNDRKTVLDSSRQCLDFDNSLCNFSSVLKDLISCPPIDSGELDIFNFLNEVRGHLGTPMIYQQDIRVLKTPHLSKEIHFFKNSHVLYTDDILKCQEAFEEGHTIALRGMEFRFENIAAIVDGLAYLFGQPSAGANIYLTPPNSQGLARHYDDHCVFVCQLTGAKKWKVYPQLSPLLPRLYEPVNSLDDYDGVSNESKHFLLREGDILYIPRGFPHEACTFLENEKPDQEFEFSLHLTLAIEVEAPFEWEGFAHVALYSWFQDQYQGFSSSHDLDVISMNLLHVAIKLIGDRDPKFRKACLVGAVSLLSDGQNRIYHNQKIIFSHLIKTIDSKSSFSDAFDNVTLSLGKNEDPFRKLRWLQKLSEVEIFDLQKWMICNELREKAEDSFVSVKSKFCNEVIFEDGGKCYNRLLQRYREVRKKYTNGMLSLHCY